MAVKLGAQVVKEKLLCHAIIGKAGGKELIIRCCCCFRPQVVKEKLLCHAIIGKAGGKELIMRVPLSCEFITPLLEFSSDKLNFRVDKVRKILMEISHSQIETMTDGVITVAVSGTRTRTRTIGDNRCWSLSLSGAV